ncbi:MAG: sigma-70 family RNA polymerase sigma factor [Sedimentibacter sp.]|uniref:RNA polymerase sigma factor n=1 Tax=Sedimentibacter sp. TaxID=1960295 RepID=UPI003158DB2A
MDSFINHIIQESLNGDKKSQEILLERLRPLIYKNIYRYFKPWDISAEDMVQEGYAEILQSLKSFDSGRNVHFLHYVKTRLTYLYRNQYRKARRLKRETSLSSLIGDSLQLEHVLGSCTCVVEEYILKEEKAELSRCLRQLSKKEQEIVSMYYCTGLSMVAISSRLGIKYSTVSAIKSRALRKLRAKLHRR